MESNEIGLLKSDLDAVKTAAGLGPRMGLEDVGYGIAVASIGLMLAAHDFLTRDLSGPWTHLFLALIIGFALYFGFKYRKGPARTVARDREYKLGFQFSALIILGVVLFNVWLLALDVKGFHAPSGTLLLMGVCLMHIALSDRWRLSYLGWGLPLVIYGFIEPWMSYETWRDLLGICIFCAGILASGILALQLKSTTPETMQKQN